MNANYTVDLRAMKFILSLLIMFFTLIPVMPVLQYSYQMEYRTSGVWVHLTSARKRESTSSAQFRNHESDALPSSRRTLPPVSNSTNMRAELNIDMLAILCWEVNQCIHN